jgi:hypothetical protein
VGLKLTVAPVWEKSVRKISVELYIWLVNGVAGSSKRKIIDVGDKLQESTNKAVADAA